MSSEHPGDTGRSAVALADGKHCLRSAIRIGIEAARREPLAAAGFVGASLAQGALQGAFVWALRDFLQMLSVQHTRSGGVFVAGALAILAIWVLRSLSTLGGEVWSAHLAHSIEVGEQQRLLAKLLTLPVRFFERTSQGDLALACYNDVKGLRAVGKHLGTIVLSISRLAGLVVAVWLMSPRLATIALVAVPLGAVPAYWVGRRLLDSAREERETAVSLSDQFLQVSSGIRVVKVNSGEARVLERVRQVGRQAFRHFMHQARVAASARFLLDAVSGLGLIGVLVVGGLEVAGGTVSWQSLLGILIAVTALYAPVVNLLAVYSSMQVTMPGLERVARILETPADIRDVPDAQPLPQGPAVIELEDVWFAYGDRPVLRGVSATITAGETIGIVGPSGAGKTTLVALLLRLYDPTRGRILLDGVDVRQIRHSDLMARCAIVLQEPFLFDDTIGENIRFGRPGAAISDVIEAARLANIHDDIMLTERGYDTLLGRHRHGRGLSTGQKQRVCIAAAILKDAPLLFLDEATSNLDSVSERKVQVAVERLMRGRTTFVIAHRLSTLRMADRILVLDDGRLVGTGSHDELLESCPLYSLLWEQQQLAGMKANGVTTQ